MRMQCHVKKKKTNMINVLKDKDRDRKKKREKKTILSILNSNI